MDTSTEYIDMCREAIEIQNGRKWEDGDFVSYYSNVCVHQDRIDWGKVAIWLPRQDQLIDMCLERLTPLQKMSIITRYFEEQGIAYYWQFKSMEQLLLTFVMFEHFKQYWNGTTWEV